LSKSGFHLRFPDPEDFGAMLVDLAIAAKPAFCLMDAVVSMEGEGPANGRPVDTGLLLASRDPLALDWVASSVIGYDPFELPYLVDAASRGPWISGPGDIEIVGLSISEARPASFELVPLRSNTMFVTNRLPAPLRRLLRNVTVARPFFDHAKCVRCGDCVNICPAKALDFVPDGGAARGKRIRIDYEKCIRCYCCHEICLEDAIRLARRPF
jgi:ferredoxin